MLAELCISKSQWTAVFVGTHRLHHHIGQAEALAAALAFPNPYCLSKWLAERLVAERCAAGLPAVLVRPAIIGAVAAAPYPG